MAAILYALALLVIVAAAARLTRLIVRDKITEPARMFVATRLPEGSKLTYLIHCAWCTGLWISFAVVTLAWFAGLGTHVPGVPWWAAIPLLALAVSHFIGLATRLDQND